MSNVSPSAIYDILDAIVGDVLPHGDSYYDSESQLNIPRFAEVCHYVYDKVYAAECAYDSDFASMRKTARMLVKSTDGLLTDFSDLGTSEGRTNAD